MASKNSRVGSVSEFLKWVSETRKNWKKREEYGSEWVPWFRGEPRADYATALRPKLFRKDAKLKELLYEEQELRLEFWRRGVQLTAEERPIDTWERYFLMQHYSVPTRLLDWSDGALVALYFAVGGDRDLDTDRQSDAAVYALDPWWLNDKAFAQWPGRKKDRHSGVALPDWEVAKAYLPEEFENRSLRPSLPLAVDPTHIARRVAAQRSRFVIFGRDSDGLRTAEQTVASGNGLTFIRVSRKAAKRIRRELATAGISESTIYPDLEGLGRELTYWWKDRQPQKRR
jgi:FRG domain